MTTTEDTISIRSHVTMPFTMVVDSITTDPQVSDRAFRLYVLLSSYGRTPENSFASRATLAKRLNSSTRTISRALDDLELAGWVRREARYLLPHEGGGYSIHNSQVPGSSRTSSGYVIFDQKQASGANSDPTPVPSVSPPPVTDLSPPPCQKWHTNHIQDNQMLNRENPDPLTLSVEESEVRPSPRENIVGDEITFVSEPPSHSPSPAKKGAKAKKTRVSDYDQEIIDLCNQLKTRIDAYSDSSHRVTAKWCSDMDLLHRLGPTEWEDQVIPVETISKGIDFIFTQLATPSNKGFCWAKQVQSPGALRRHWAQIRSEANNMKKSRPRNQLQYREGVTETDYAAKINERMEEV